MSTASVSLKRLVKEVGQTGTTARHNTQTGRKYCDDHSPLKSPAPRGYNFPCSTTTTRLARRRCRRRRRISTPFGLRMAWPWSCVFGRYIGIAVQMRWAMVLHGTRGRCLGACYSRALAQELHVFHRVSAGKRWSRQRTPVSHI